MLSVQQPTARTLVLDSKYHEKALNEIVKRNKKCADCLKPSPSFVNLSVGTFVCLECSGLLREFGFRTKGVGLSTFTPQEVQMLDLSGGNKRATELWLGKHPDGEKATPGWDNIEVLKRFLARKYRDKQWYDESVAAKPAEPVRSRADSAASNSGLESPQATGRKRVGSKDVISRGANAVMVGSGSSHRSFLAATHARAAAQHNNSAQASPAQSDEDKDTEDEDEEDEDSSEGECKDPAEREKKQKDGLRKKIHDFYKMHNPEKLDSLDLFVEWVMYHGMGAFNKKLREKYGTDIPSERKKDLQTQRDKQKAREKLAQRQMRPPRKEILEQAIQLQALEDAAQAMALQDLASRKRAGSTNPFDDFGAAVLSTSPATMVRNNALMIHASGDNPFEDLMFL